MNVAQSIENRILPIYRNDINSICRFSLKNENYF